MKQQILKNVAKKLTHYKKIDTIQRVLDNCIKIKFDKDEPYYFNLQKGDSYIYKNPNQKQIKNYTAPFDVVLKKRFTNAKIEQIYLLPDDKILQIHTTLSSKYKSQKTILQLEFTGRHTNAIILDKDEIIIEALRHIDISNSFREIKVGIKLLPLPKKEFKEKDIKIDDLDKYLFDEFKKREEKELLSLKKQKLQSLQKQKAKLQKLLNDLEDENTLLKKSSKLEYEGGLVLSNLHLIKNYQDQITLKDYDGKEITINLPKGAKTAANGANILFKRAKKLKQKAKNLHIERDNLSQKVAYQETLIDVVNNAKNTQELKLYFPKQKKIKKSKIKDTNIEEFFYKDYKISLGKNQKGNIALLKKAKMNDFWLHLKDMPSSHVIITTDKKRLPDDVLEFGAKLCVNFSTKERGKYLVDYTPRRNIKTKEGANVNYIDYKTIFVIKD